MKRALLVLMALSMLLGGCSWMDGDYLSVVPHQEQLAINQSETLSASNYRQLCRVLSNLVSAGTESAVIRVSEYEQSRVATDMEAAVQYLREQLPLGAYAVEDVTYEIGTGGGQPAISVSISYIHGRSAIRKIQNVANMEEAEYVIGQVLRQCSDGVVLLVEDYAEADIAQLVEDYAGENPDLVMETPQVAVGLYPDSGDSRVMELKFTYQTSRDALRQMQTQVQRVFHSASLYVSSNSDATQKYTQLYTFLTERFEYKIETSITPAYSLLCHGVGDSEAFATAYGAMCRAANLDCYIVSGTRNGEPRFWNIIQADDLYYHVDLLQSKDAGQFQMLTDAQMEGYVWDYSAYPAAGSNTADQ